jgi:hypothetical protein
MELDYLPVIWRKRFNGNGMGCRRIQMKIDSYLLLAFR